MQTHKCIESFDGAQFEHTSSRQPTDRPTTEMNGIDGNRLFVCECASSCAAFCGEDKWTSNEFKYDLHVLYNNKFCCYSFEWICVAESAPLQLARSWRIKLHCLLCACMHASSPALCPHIHTQCVSFAILHFRCGLIPYFALDSTDPYTYPCVIRVEREKYRKLEVIICWSIQVSTLSRKHYHSDAHERAKWSHKERKGNRK